MGIYESGENYLETILILERETDMVRSIDVANAFGYSKASISRAMGILKDAGYITIERGGGIHLTEKGREKAEAIYERHNLVSKYLMEALGVSEEAALDDACKIEHIISEESFSKIKEWIEKNGK